MKKVVALLLAVALTICTLTACSTPDAENADKNSDVSPTNDSTTQSVVDPNKEYTINFWHGETDDSRIAGMQAVIDGFKSVYPMSQLIRRR